MTPHPDGDDVFNATGMADLAALVALLERACARVGASAGAVSDLRLATEEVFANILSHGYGGQPGPVTVRVEATPAQVIVTLADAAPDFDPADAAAPDIGAQWAQRPLGGLGWHLVYQVMDEVRRESRAQGGNVYTLVKKLSALRASTDK